MSTQGQSPFEVMMDQLNGLPLWIKQVLYVQLRYELTKILTKTTVDTFGENDILQLMVPQINHSGRVELERPSGKNPMEVMKVLYWSSLGKNVMNICVINEWTLEQCCSYLFTAIERGYVMPPASTIIQATLLYLGGKIRLGDFLVKTGRLKFEQLDQALRTQQYIQESLGERTGIGNILINLGYIQKQDCEAILFLKEESKKPFPASILSSPGTGGGSTAGGGIDANTFARVQADLREAKDRIRQLELINQQLQQQKR